MSPDYVTDNIIVGNGEIPAIKTKTGLEWILPGGLRTRCRDCAYAAAARLNDLITPGLAPFKRRLFSPT